MVQVSHVSITMAASFAVMADPAGAQERDVSFDFTVADVAELRLAPQEWRDLQPVTRGLYTRNSERTAQVDWGTGGVALRGARLRQGRKFPRVAWEQSQWRRAYEGEMRVWGDVDPAIALEAGFVVTRATFGQNGAAVHSDRTRGITRRAALGLRGDNGMRVRLTFADQAGWDGLDLAETVAAMNNGEAREQRRFGAEWSMQRRGSREGFGLHVTQIEFAGNAQGQEAGVFWRVRF